MIAVLNISLLPTSELWHYIIFCAVQFCWAEGLCDCTLRKMSLRKLQWTSPSYFCWYCFYSRKPWHDMATVKHSQHNHYEGRIPTKKWRDGDAKIFLYFNVMSFPLYLASISEFYILGGTWYSKYIVGIKKTSTKTSHLIGNISVLKTMNLQVASMLYSTFFLAWFHFSFHYKPPDLVFSALTI